MSEPRRNYEILDRLVILTQSLTNFNGSHTNVWLQPDEIVALIEYHARHIAKQAQG